MIDCVVDCMRMCRLCMNFSRWVGIIYLFLCDWKFEKVFGDGVLFVIFCGGWVGWDVVDELGKFWILRWVRKSWVWDGYDSEGVGGDDCVGFEYELGLVGGGVVLVFLFDWWLWVGCGLF